MQNKLTALLLALVLLIAPCMGAMAEDADLAAVLTADTVDAPAAGEWIAVDIYLEVCSGVDSLEFRVNYDSAALKLKMIDDGDLFAEPYLIKNTETPGLIRVAAISAEGLNSAGTVLTLHFETLSTAGSAIILTDVAVTRVDSDYNQTLPSETHAEAVDGGVTVAGGALPEAPITPWPDFTPQPTQEPTPTPIQTPEPQTARPSETAMESIPPEETPQPEKTQFHFSKLQGTMLIAVVVAVAALVLIILLLTLGKGKKKKKKSKR